MIAYDERHEKGILESGTHNLHHGLEEEIFFLIRENPSPFQEKKSIHYLSQMSKIANAKLSGNIKMFAKLCELNRNTSVFY